VSLLLNGGGIGQIQDITTTFSTAFAGREGDLRSLTQLDQFIANVNGQSDDIIAATESLNNFRWSDRRTKTGPGQRPHDDPRCVGSAEGRT